MTLAAIATFAVAPSSAAHADPKVSAAAAQAQLQSLSDKAEILVESFDAGQDKLAAAQRLLTADRAAIAKAQSTVDANQLLVDTVASAVYESGGVDGVQALLAATEPRIALQRAGTLQLLEAQRNQQLRLATAGRNGLAQAQAAASQGLAAITALQASLKAQQHTIDGLVAQQLALLKASQAQEAAQAAAQAVAQAAAQAAAAKASRSAARAAVAPRGIVHLLVHPRLVAPAPAKKAAPAAVPKAKAAVFVGVDGRAAAALRFAYAQLNKPYRYGAAGARTFDCSGLTMRAWQAAGVSLGHNAAAQYHSTPHVARNALRPGDLVYFGHPIHHVGIYIGGGKFIEAPYTGARVRISSLSNRHDYVGASRP